jgi:hypothetical protein
VDCSVSDLARTWMHWEERAMDTVAYTIVSVLMGINIR